tara:strand:- start:280 stop:501 length:222 start_codon:yes stop_codon:yes gene_type:complete
MAYNFSEEEITEIIEKMSKIKGSVPTNLQSFMWNTYKKITGSKETQPCGCKAGIKHWEKAYNTIYSFLRTNDN